MSVEDQSAERAEAPGSLGDLRVGGRLAAGEVTGLGLGLFLGLGLLVLYGPARGLAGPAVTLAYLLAGLLCALNLAVFSDLVALTRRPVGRYGQVQATAGGLLAFLAGWTTLLGGILLAAALTLALAEQMVFVGRTLNLALPKRETAMVIAALWTLDRVTGRRIRRTLVVFVLWLPLVVLFLMVLMLLPEVSPAEYTPFAPLGLMGVMGGWAVLLATSAGLEGFALQRAQEPGRGPTPWPAWRTVALATLFLTLVAAVTVGLGPGVSGGGAGPLGAVLGRLGNRAGVWFALLVALPLGAFALQAALLLVAREAYLMCRDNVLPQELTRSLGRFTTPVPLIVLIGLSMMPLVIRGGEGDLVQVGAFCFLASNVVIVVAYLVFRERMTGWQWSGLLPYRRMSATLVMALNLLLMLELPRPPFLLGLGWLLLGGLVYLAYGRSRMREARAEVMAVRPAKEPSEKRYRVLVPMRPRGGMSPRMRLAIALARRLDGEVLPLQVIEAPDPLAMEETRRIAEERSVLFQWSTDHSREEGVPIRPSIRLAPSVARGILDTAAEEDCDLILLAWRGEARGRGAELTTILDPVVQEAPCNVAVLRGEEEVSEVRRILVPTAGGPHAPLAARLGLELARAFNGHVTVLYICRGRCDDAQMAQGVERIQQTIAGLDGEGYLTPKVVAADDVVQGILDQAQEHDLVLLGASEEGILDQILFGNVPERIARESPKPVIMVRAYRGAAQWWMRRAWQTVYAIFPTLSAEDRLDVYRELRRGARADVDYFVMIGLSGVIATLGLLMNSGAVIIGAMLVAPLMTPILALSLGIVQGDLRLLRLSLDSALRGVIVAVGLALFLSTLSPITLVTPEVQARTQPSLFDLVVALASGAAGAYAVARKDVAAALPGVAIAAALVPPLCTMGIGLAAGQAQVAGGATLLFITNLIAITLAGAVVFLLLGFRPAAGESERRAYRRRWLLTFVLLLVAIAIPLGVFLVRNVQQAHLHRTVEQALQEQLAALPGVSLADLRYDEQASGVDVWATLYVRGPVGQDVAREVNAALAGALGRPVRLHLVLIPVEELEAGP